MHATCSSPEACEPVAHRAPLPVAGLLALAMAGFITILTEALPAGLLPRMAAGLRVSEAMVGQLVTVYALGSLLAAIPLTTATQSWRRKPLLLGAIAGFALVNTVTAVSTSFALTLAARFVAGVFAGVLWALLAGHASRMVAPARQGRAIALAMLGTPLALSIGIPAGTWLGAVLGWRASFGVMSAATVLLVLWVVWAVPDFPGTRGAQRRSLREVMALPGLKSVLFAVLSFVLAHNLLYTYIAPLLALSGLDAQVEAVLLAFGVSALGGIGIAGAWVDRRLRRLALASTAAFGLASVALWAQADDAKVVIGAVLLWGMAFGGVATLFQTAAARTAGAAADVAQSMLVTAWNLAIAGGGLLGGALLGLDALALPIACVPLLTACGVAVWRARRAGFPAA